MSRQLLDKPLTEEAVEQPWGTTETAAGTDVTPDFEYRPIPSRHVLKVKARVQTVTVGKPMEYDFTEE